MDIVMPRLTDSMEEGTIIAWLKKSGDEVAVGEDLVEIETDKASMVYESDLAGTLEILVGENETRPIGEPIATVGGGAPPAKDDASEKPAAEAVTEAAPQPESEPPTPPAEAASGKTGERIHASPLARRIAGEKGVDLAAITGSGPGGRIIKADVEGASGPGPAAADTGRSGGVVGGVTTAKGATTRVELNRTQQTIARRMAESKATAPHFYLRAEVDMSRAVEVRTAFKQTAGADTVVPSLNDMVVKAVAVALRDHPRANGSYRDGGLELFSRINVGIAVAADEALIVPTIVDADHKELREISTESRRLAARVRDGSITPPELSGGTFTVSNLGMFGIRSFDAVINGGQAAILAVGEIAERPVVRDGAVTSAQIMEVSLACDHRILYGAEAAEFLAEIRRNLEEPGLLA